MGTTIVLGSKGSLWNQTICIWVASAIRKQSFRFDLKGAGFWPTAENLSPRAGFEFQLLEIYPLAVPFYLSVSLPTSFNPPAWRAGSQPLVPGRIGSVSPPAASPLQKSPPSPHPRLGLTIALTWHPELDLLSLTTTYLCIWPRKMSTHVFVRVIHEIIIPLYTHVCNYTYG